MGTCTTVTAADCLFMYYTVNCESGWVYEHIYYSEQWLMSVSFYIPTVNNEWRQFLHIYPTVIDVSYYIHTHQWTVVDASFYIHAQQWLMSVSTYIPKCELWLISVSTYIPNSEKWLMSASTYTYQQWTVTDISFYIHTQQWNVRASLTWALIKKLGWSSLLLYLGHNMRNCLWWNAIRTRESISRCSLGNDNVL